MENNNRIEEVKLHQYIDKEGMNQSKRYEQLAEDLDNIQIDTDNNPSWSQIVPGKDQNNQHSEDSQPNQSSKRPSEDLISKITTSPDKYDSSITFSTGVLNSKRNMREKMTEDELQDYIRNKRVDLLFIENTARKREDLEVEMDTIKISFNEEPVYNKAKHNET